MSKDPLNDLLVDSEEVDKKRITNVLKPYAGIDSKDGKIVFKPDFNGLKSKQQLMAYLLGKKVAKLLGILETEKVKPKTIPEETDLPGGTVRPNLKDLLEDRIISKSEEGYFIKNHQLLSALGILK